MMEMLLENYNDYKVIAGALFLNFLTPDASLLMLVFRGGYILSIGGTS
jgi:hypothetical protein